MDIIDSLIDDHEQIKKHMPLLLLCSDYVRGKQALPKNFSAALRFLKEFVIEFHHGREEKYLFPFVASHVKVSEGGPACTKFMGLRIMSSMNKDIFDLEAELGHRGYPAASEIQPYLQQQNPITIPMSEHEAETILVRLMERGDVAKIAWALERYYDLLREHSQKEDECLFIMARRILDTELLRNANIEADLIKEQFMQGQWREIEAELLLLSKEIAEFRLRLSRPGRGEED